jgi:16S rRNA processing protein RimM
VEWRPARVRVGTAGRAHGIYGAFRVTSPCGWWDFPAGSTVLLEGVERRVRSSSGTAEQRIVHLEGVDDRDAATALGGAALELPRESVPEPEDDAYFHFDLVGCAAYAGERMVGRVKAVEEGVAHDILVLDDEAETRIPFVSELVPGVDVPGRRLELADWLAP